MILLTLLSPSLATSPIYENDDRNVKLFSLPAIQKIQQTELMMINVDVLNIIIRKISAVDQAKMRLVCQYFSSFILNFKDNNKYNWGSLQLLMGLDSLEEWERIRIQFFTFSPDSRKKLLQTVTNDLITINDGEWRGDVLHKLIQLPCDEWDDVLDCEFAKKDIIYGFLKNQITILIPISILGIILYPGSHHFLSHLLLSGFSIVRHNNLIDDFFRFERFLKNLSTWKFNTYSITWNSTS